MNKISGIPNYNNRISFNRTKNSENLSRKSNTEIASNEQYMTSEVSSASRAYGLSFINNKTIPQMSLSDLLKWLESQNKVEGKDFKVDLDNSDVTILNKFGQEEFVIHYDKGNHDFWGSYESYEYKNGKLYKSMQRDKDNNISLITQTYNNDDPAIEHLLEFTYGTTPEEFLQTLKDRNIDCDIKYPDAGDVFNNVHINVYDENKKITEEYSFNYFDNKNSDGQYYYASKHEYNEDGQEYRYLNFNKDTTDVTLFI